MKGLFKKKQLSKKQESQDQKEEHDSGLSLLDYLRVPWTHFVY